MRCDWLLCRPNIARDGFSFQRYNMLYLEIDDAAASTLAFFNGTVKQFASLDRSCVTGLRHAR